MYSRNQKLETLLFIDKKNKNNMKKPRSPYVMFRWCGHYLYGRVTNINGSYAVCQTVNGQLFKNIPINAISSDWTGKFLYFIERAEKVVKNQNLKPWISKIGEEPKFNHSLLLNIK